MDNTDATEQAMALITDSEKWRKREAVRSIRSEYLALNRPVPGSLEADVFTYHGKSLIITRPALPITERKTHSKIRLRRA